MREGARIFFPLTPHGYTCQMPCGFIRGDELKALKFSLREILKVIEEIFTLLRSEVFALA